MTRVICTLVGSILASASLFAQEDPDIAIADGHERYSRSAYEAGRRDATRDLRDGHLIHEFYGGPPIPWIDDWSKFLQEKYHIQIKVVAGCVVDERIVGHARGYNEVSEAEIDRKFGADFVMKTFEEFGKKWREHH